MNIISEFVSREMLDKINQFIELLLKWNNKINLISKCTIKEIMNRHVLDSLQLLKYITKEDLIIDLGSGAGLPALVLSIAGVQNITLIESDSRKCAFLLQASRLSYNNIIILNDRVENIKGLQCDILTSRAFARLDKIFEISSNIIVRDKYLLHKGSGYKSEIQEAQKLWLFKTKLHDSISSKDGKILEISNLERIK